MLSFIDTFNYYAAQGLNPKIAKALLLPLSFVIPLEPTETEYRHTLKAAFSALP